MATMISSRGVESDGEDSPSPAAAPSAAMRLVQRMPRQPAPSVAEISSLLYAAYTVEGGNVRLAGCTLEPQPIVHATGRCLQHRPDGTVSEQPIELFLTAAGNLLSAATVSDLGLNNLIAAEKPPRLDAGETERLAAIGRQAVEARCKDLGGRTAFDRRWQ